MKKLAICALAVITVTCIAQAQDTYDHNATIYSGPWHLRSTGDKAADRLWFIMDRTLNSAEMQTLKDMFNYMPPNEAHHLQKAILYAIDQCSGNDPQYSVMNVGGWSKAKFSDDQIYRYMGDGLGSRSSLYLDDWRTHATTDQMMAVAKLVRCGGWANSVWMSSGLNTQ